MLLAVVARCGGLVVLVSYFILKRTGGGGAVAIRTPVGCINFQCDRDGCREFATAYRRKKSD